jgi:NAD(P)H-dependent FMN reductase
MEIMAFCGSLRRASLNRRLLDALADHAPAGTSVSVLDWRAVPVFDQDLEDEAFPAAVTALQDAIESGDALLIVSPEYNGGVPGGLKNAIDWCTRGGRMREVFGGRPTALAGATPGGGGTRHAQTAWLQTFRVLGVDAWMAGQLYVPRAHTLFDADGRLDDAAMGERLTRFMTGFTAFAQR